jgi:hypothetical protein
VTTRAQEASGLAGAEARRAEGETGTRCVARKAAAVAPSVVGDHWASRALAALPPEVVVLQRA